MLKNPKIILNLMVIAALQLWMSPLFACSSITLVSSNSHFAMVHRIEASLYAQPNPKPKLKHVIAENIEGENYFEKRNDSCLIVTIGSEALTNVLKTQTKLPILSVLVRKGVFHYLLTKHDRKLGDPQYPISVIYLDQPLERQLLLLQSLSPKQDKNQIGILLGPNSLQEQEYLQHLAQKNKFLLNTVYVNKFENPVAVLDALLDEVKIVLAIPDSRIYNSKTTRGMLLTAFHKRVPLIGYSKTYVNNGALASVYSTTKQLADQTAEQILQFSRSKDQKLPSAQYPREFAVAVNYQVARSLGLAVDSETALKYSIEKMEKQNHG
jgi:ABC-type uncharacterized transport system substrate-binding protein